jgi:type VI secretion system secreted protein VgrG
VSTERAARVEIEAISGDLRVERARVVERVHAPWSIDVVAALDGSRPALRAVVGSPARFAFPLPEGGERRFEGLVVAVEARRARISFTIAPRLALLGEGRDYRVFVGETPLDVVESVLASRRVAVERRIVRRAASRPQLVQAFESDLDFARRLAADEGAVLVVDPTRPDAVRLVDHPAGFDALAGAPIAVVADAGLVSGEAVVRARRTLRVAPDAVTLRDYDFTRPMLDQTASARASDGPLERYAFPGGHADPAVGRERAALRLDALRGGSDVLEAETTCRRLAAGSVAQLDGGPRTGFTGGWLVTAVEHELFDGVEAEAHATHYQARMRAVPAAGGFRPEAAPAPAAAGVATAMVTGPSGAELHADPHGRVVVRHRWDRRRAPDEHASGPARVVQPALSGGLFEPRVGWEVLVAFGHGSPDAPIVLGRLDNGRARPAVSLPGGAASSRLGSRSTPGGGGANAIALSDAAGSEGFGLAASKDWNERTENDKTASVDGSDATTISGSRTLAVGNVLSVAVQGAEACTIGADRTLHVGANELVGAGSESVTVGGLRALTIGGDYVTSCGALARVVGGARVETGIEHVNRAVQGSSTVLVGGARSALGGLGVNVAVTGVHTEVVAGPKSVAGLKLDLGVRGPYVETLASRSVHAGGGRGETFGASAAYSIGGAASFEGADVVIKAKGSLTVRAGGVTISMTPGSIVIRGDVKSAATCVDAGTVEYG